jgi:hypothetical protein
LKEFGGIDSFQDKIALFQRLIKRKIDPILDKGCRPDTLDLPYYGIFEEYPPLSLNEGERSGNNPFLSIKSDSIRLWRRKNESF